MSAQYKNHRQSSRKGSVHKCFDNHGATRALAYGRMRGLKESTVKQWVSKWRQEQKVNDVNLDDYVATTNATAEALGE